MGVAERYVREEQKQRKVRRRAMARCIAFGAAGFVLPALLMTLVWLTFTVLNIMPLARSRLAVMLTPTGSELGGTFIVMLLFAAPYLVQAGNALRLLDVRGSRRQRGEWRNAGCFAGLCLATFIVFVFVVPFDAAWVRPGLGVPTHVLGIYYALALGLGAVGGWIGRFVGGRLSARGGSPTRST